MGVIQAAGKPVLALEAVHPDGVAVSWIEHLERNQVIGGSPVVRPVDRGGSAVANHTVDHVFVEAIVGHRHALRLRFRLGSGPGERNRRVILDTTF